MGLAQILRRGLRMTNRGGNDRRGNPPGDQNDKVMGNGLEEREAAARGYLQVGLDSSPLAQNDKLVEAQNDNVAVGSEGKHRWGVTEGCARREVFRRSSRLGRCIRMEYAGIVRQRFLRGCPLGGEFQWIFSRT